MAHLSRASEDVTRTLPVILSPAEVDALTGRVAHAPGPGDGRGDGAGPAVPLAEGRDPTSDMRRLNRIDE